MSAINLDPSKLLGFKIIADSESTVRLTSPKIGDKDCVVYADAPSAVGATSATLQVNIGTMTD